MKNCDYEISKLSETQGLNFELNGDESYYILSSTAYNTDLVIPETFEGKPVRKIGNGAFASCHFLTGITISDNVTHIGERAFCGCKKLKCVTLGKGVRQIGHSAFEDCDHIERVYYAGDLASWCALLGLDNLTGSDCEIFIDGKPLSGDLYIPFGVTEIFDHSFRGRKNLTKVNFPNGVKRIGCNAFCYCRGLTEIVIASGLESICDYAFWGCRSLNRIKFNGTKEQWRAIEKGNDWNGSCGNYTVHCSDGKLDKYGNDIAE